MQTESEDFLQAVIYLNHLNPPNLYEVNSTLKPKLLCSNRHTTPTMLPYAYGFD